MDTLLIAFAFLAPVGVAASFWLAVASAPRDPRPQVLMGYRR